MSSSSVDAGMHDDTGNVAGSGLEDRVDLSVSETLAKEPAIGGPGDNDGCKGEGLEKEGDSVALEVDSAVESDSKAGSMGSERVVDVGGDSSLESRNGPLNVERDNGGVSEESKGLVGFVDMEVGADASVVPEKPVSEMADDSDVKHSMEPKNLSPKPLNDEGLGGEVKAKDSDELLPCAEKTIDGKVVGVSYSVAENNETVGINKESDRVHVEAGGVLESKGVDVVVSVDECAGKDKKKGKKKGKFCAYDLVWGKVRSHPWWPAQIFESGDASDMARKHLRPKCHLVAYFGDHTFAWNEEAKLKLFVPHYSQMVKQTGMEAFQDAVDCALDEVSRRVEFGLSCHCIKDDVYDELKTQIIENAGVREQRVVLESVDKSFGVSSFEPIELLNYITNLALGPHAEVDKLEHVMAQGRLSAFYRWKGHYHLPEFAPLIGYISNEADASISKPNEETSKAVDDEKVTEGTLEKCGPRGNRPEKRKKMSGDIDRPTKKKCSSDLVLKRGSSKKEGGEKSEGKGSRKSSSFSASSGRASKLLHKGSKSENSGLQSLGTTPTASKEVKPSFRVGESILRVAGLLSKPSPLLKLDASSHGKTDEPKASKKQNLKQTKVGSPLQSSDEILSHLQSAAREPLEDHSMLISMVNFFSNLRNSVLQDDDVSVTREESAGTEIVAKSEETSTEVESARMAQKYSPSIKSKEKASDSEVATSGVGSMEDASCPKLISASESHAFSSDENGAVVGPVLMKMNGASVVLLGNVDEKTQVEDSPTAFTLKFTDIESIPSEAKLNQIFSHFGSLREFETQILTKKKCARVVFKKRVDAETAFSSSGKFEIFGPSLVSYRLHDAPSPCKLPSVEAKRRRRK